VYLPISYDFTVLTHLLTASTGFLILEHKSDMLREIVPVSEAHECLTLLAERQVIIGPPIGR
jgi:hypothetical protein